jgi:hypothetical protein
MLLQSKASRCRPLGHRRWAIAEGYIPSESSFSNPTLVSHETACILNAGDRDAQVAITIYFADREPAGPFRVTIEARRTLHLRFNDLTDPQPIPRDTDYASIFESDVLIVVQHTRLGFTPCRDRPLVDGSLRGGLRGSQPTADAEPFALRNVGRREWVPAGAVSQ